MPQAHAIAGEFGWLLHLLTDLDKLVPRLGRLDLGSVEDIHAGDQWPRAHRLGTIALSLYMTVLRENGKRPPWTSCIFSTTSVTSRR